MDIIKKASGVLWIALSVLAIWFLFTRAIHELSLPDVKPDKKIFWYSILPVYIPLMAGLALFGWYAIKGEYNKLAEEYNS